MELPTKAPAWLQASLSPIGHLGSHIWLPAARICPYLQPSRLEWAPPRVCSERGYYWIFEKTIDTGAPISSINTQTEESWLWFVFSRKKSTVILFLRRTPYETKFVFKSCRNSFLQFSPISPIIFMPIAQKSLSEIKTILHLFLN